MSEPLTDDEAAALTRELEKFGETAVAKATGLHRQTLNRAANRRRLYSRTRDEIRHHLHRLVSMPVG